MPLDQRSKTCLPHQRSTAVVFWKSVKISVLLTAIAVGILSSSYKALAQSSGTLSANYFLPGCLLATDENAGFVKAADYKTGLCMGAVMTLFWLAGDRIDNICPPPTSTIDQALRVVVRYLKQHPDGTHLGFVELAIAAMAEAWPCAK
jgi:hypothetical protein